MEVFRGECDFIDSLWTGSRFFLGKKIAKEKERGGSLSPVPRSTKGLLTGYFIEFF